MAWDDMKLPLFHGKRINDPEQYWFLCEAVWTVRHATDYEIKKGQLVTTLRGSAIDCFMKFIQVPQGTWVKTLDEIQMALIEEFRKSKLEAQYITELNEIKQFPNETIWDFDQRFKTLMARVSFSMSDVQHKEWLIIALVSHI